MSESKRGNQYSLGIQRSHETCEKISQAAKNPSLEAREKMSDHAKARNGMKNSFFGKKHSIETKEKISSSSKGRLLSETSKQKLRDAAKFRKPISEETRKRLSDSAKQRWQKEKESS